VPLTAFEAWCPRCRVTWPPEARTCVHCGGRVAPTRALADDVMQGGAAPAAAEIRSPQPAEAAAPRSPLRLLRVGIAVLWLALALAGSLLRHCHPP